MTTNNNNPLSAENLKKAYDYGFSLIPMIGPLYSAYKTGNAIGNAIGNAMAGGPSYNNMLTSYGNSGELDYNISPDKKALFEQMMREKALGGSGNVARSQVYGDKQPSAVVGPEPIVPIDNIPVNADINNLSSSNNLNVTNDALPTNIPLIPITDNSVQPNVGQSSQGNIILNNVPQPQNAEVNAQPSSQAGSTFEQLAKPEGLITPQQMRENIDKYYEGMKSVANQNPLYGGEYVRPEGYSVNPDIVRRYAMSDLLAGRTGDNAYLNQYNNMLKAQYQANIANQAGVPYEDYKEGMLERNKLQLELEKQQVTDQLTAYAQQATDMNSRLRILADLQKAREGYDAEIRKIEAQGEQNRALENIKTKGSIAQELIKGDIGYRTETLKQQGDLYKEYYKANNPQAVLLNYAKTMLNLAVATGGDMNALANMMASMPPETQTRIYGRVLSPEEHRKMIGAVQQMNKSNPGWQSNFQNFLNTYNMTNTNFGL